MLSLIYFEITEREMLVRQYLLTLQVSRYCLFDLQIAYLKECCYKIGFCYVNTSSQPAYMNDPNLPECYWYHPAETRH